MAACLGTEICAEDGEEEEEEEEEEEQEPVQTIKGLISLLIHYFGRPLHGPKMLNGKMTQI